MGLSRAVLIVVVTTSVAVGAILLVRRRAPDGGYFNDGDRAAGVFGVLATGFSVLLGFVVFLAFTSYDTSRVGAESEALVVAQQVETAQRLPGPVAAELTGELVCYARTVVGPQWDRMETGTLGDEINPWGVQMFHTVSKVTPQTTTEEVAYSKWIDETSAREDARNDRMHGAAGVIPKPLWVVLFFVAGVIFVYMLFFADRGERALVQAVLMGSVTAVLTAMLVLLQFLNQPFHAGIGGLRPVAMERTLGIIDQQILVTGAAVQAPCDGRGNAR